MSNKKFRVIIDLNFTSKKKFEYDFRFVNVSKPGYEISALDLVEYLKEVVRNIEQKHTDPDTVSVKDNKVYHWFCRLLFKYGAFGLFSPNQETD